MNTYLVTAYSVAATGAVILAEVDEDLAAIGGLLLLVIGLLVWCIGPAMAWGISHKYASRDVRHEHETETEARTSNVQVLDTFLRRETRKSSIEY